MPTKVHSLVLHHGLHGLHDMFDIVVQMLAAVRSRTSVRRATLIDLVIAAIAMIGRVVSTSTRRLVEIVVAVTAAKASAVLADVTMVSTDLRGRVALVRTARNFRLLVSAMSSSEVGVALVMAAAAIGRIAQAVRIETIDRRVATSMVRVRRRVGHFKCEEHFQFHKS